MRKELNTTSESSAVRLATKPSTDKIFRTSGVGACKTRRAKTPSCDVASCSHNPAFMISARMDLEDQFERNQVAGVSVSRENFQGGT